MSVSQFRTYDPNRYRILKITPPQKKPYYIVQKRFLWWWYDWVKTCALSGSVSWTSTYASFDAAKTALLRKIDRQVKEKREVILDRKA